MGIISGGGGSGGPSAGTYLPVADASGVTVNTTTYNDNIKGSGKLTTLVFPVEQGALALAITGDTFPRWVLSPDPTDYSLSFDDGAHDSTGSHGAAFAISGTTWDFNAGSARTSFNFNKPVAVVAPLLPSQVPPLSQLSPYLTIVSTALPTVQLVSGAGSAAMSGAGDVETHTPVTFNPGVATTATCLVQLSPDGVTYSTLAVITKPVGTVFDGSIEDVIVRVPTTWFLKLTVTNATLGLTTYY